MIATNAAGTRELFITDLKFYIDMTWTPAKYHLPCENIALTTEHRWICHPGSSYVSTALLRDGKHDMHRIQLLSSTITDGFR